MTIVVRSEHRDGGYDFYVMPDDVDPRMETWPRHRLDGRYVKRVGTQELRGIRCGLYSLNDAAIREAGGVLLTRTEAAFDWRSGVLGMPDSPELRAIITPQSTQLDQP